MLINEVSIILPKRKDGATYSGLSSIGQELEARGCKVDYIPLERIEDYKIKYQLIFTHNLIGIEEIQKRYGDFKYVSILDNPLNKFEKIRLIKVPCLMLLCDDEYQSLIERVTDENVSFGIWSAYNNSPYEETIKPLHERKYDIVFVGRIDKNQKPYDGLSVLDKLLMKRITRRMIFRGDKQIHSLVRDVINSNRFFRFIFKKHLSDTKESWDFLHKLSHNIRSLKRMKLVKELMNLEGRKILLCTDKYTIEKFQRKIGSNIETEIMLPWKEVVRRMGDSKFAINIHPFHVNNTHERVCVAQSAGAIVLSDQNYYLKEQFDKEKTGIIFKLEEDFSTQFNAIEKRKELNEIQVKAAQFVRDNDSRQSRVNLLLTQIHSWVAEKDLD